MVMDLGDESYPGCSNECVVIIILIDILDGPGRAIAF